MLNCAGRVQYVAQWNIVVNDVLMRGRDGICISCHGVRWPGRTMDRRAGKTGASMRGGRWCKDRIGSIKMVSSASEVAGKVSKVQLFVNTICYCWHSAGSQVGSYRLFTYDVRYFSASTSRLNTNHSIVHVSIELRKYPSLNEFRASGGSGTIKTAE